MGNKKILIVDRNVDFRHAISSKLREQFSDLDVIEAEDGEAALEALAERPHVVITSLRLPKINGYDLVKIARENDFSSSFIVFTGDNLVDRDRLPTGTPVFLKPYDVDAMFGCIRLILRRAA